MALKNFASTGCFNISKNFWQTNSRQFFSLTHTNLTIKKNILKVSVFFCYVEKMMKVNIKINSLVPSGFFVFLTRKERDRSIL